VVRRPSRRAVWTAGFLTVTGLAIVMELIASFDGSPDTDAWTDLIVAWVPAEVATVLLGALIGWLPVHFAIRYWRRSRRGGGGDDRR
jgi:peptidoglycan/LPS O-acetylase OafA/YrhL